MALTFVFVNDNWFINMETFGMTEIKNNAIIIAIGTEANETDGWIIKGG